MRNELKVLNLSTELQNAVPDAKVGISLAYLAGDEQLASYGVELEPGSHVKAHYHPDNVEIYQILSGKGVMKTGYLQNNAVKWNEPAIVQKGDFFTIHAGMVHRLENTSTEKLILIATCSPLNLSTNRILVE